MLDARYASSPCASWPLVIIVGTPFVDSGTSDVHLVGMATNLPAERLFEFITRDFESAWDSMARQPEELPGGGNFMFGRQAMMLLEWAARVCRADASGGAGAGRSTPSLNRLSQELAQLDRRYFTELPAVFPKRTSEREFTLPSVGPSPDRELLLLLFDLIRNGQAHQYQQINVDLSDGTELQIALTGVSPGLALDTITTRPTDHLAFGTFGAGNVALIVRTDVLYLDIKAATERAGLPTSGLQLEYLERDQYPFTAADLMTALRSAAHPQVQLPASTS